MKNFTLSVLAMLLVACSTTEQANETMVAKFKGTKADSFFIKYGPPAQGYRTSDGQTIYIWAEQQKNYYMPPSAYTTINYIGTTAYATTNFIGGGTMEVQCQVKILANKRGIIEEIEAHRDTWGDWETSRCHELFKS
jgi:hypothetical protein